MKPSGAAPGTGGSGAIKPLTKSKLVEEVFENPEYGKEVSKTSNEPTESDLGYQVLSENYQNHFLAIGEENEDQTEASGKDIFIT